MALPLQRKCRYTEPQFPPYNLQPASRRKIYRPIKHPCQYSGFLHSSEYHPQSRKLFARQFAHQ